MEVGNGRDAPDQSAVEDPGVGDHELHVGSGLLDRFDLEVADSLGAQAHRPSEPGGSLRGVEDDIGDVPTRLKDTVRQDLVMLRIGAGAPPDEDSSCQRGAFRERTPTLHQQIVTAPNGFLSVR